MLAEKTEGNETQKTVESETETQEAANEESTIKEKLAEEVEEAPKAPEPTAIGDENIAILRHDMYRRGGDNTTESTSIEMVTKNVSETAIGSILFEAELYDIDGNILDNIEQKTTDFKLGVTRKIILKYSGPESDKVRSYSVKVAKITMTPESKVTGNEKIKIIKHSLSRGFEDYYVPVGGADISIRNVSDITIASLVFEAVFYDIEGNVLDTVKRREIDLKPNTSRAVNISCTKQEVHKLKSYDVKIIRMATADVEKVQLRYKDRRTTNTGEEEVRGIIKNITNIKTDTALVATFFNQEKECIGTKVIILKDIEPNCTRQFHFMFKPMEGDKVKSYTLDIGELVE